MTRLVALFFFIGSCLTAGAQNFYLAIGTYTTSGSKGIYIYNFNEQTGKVSWVSNTDSCTNPSYIIFSHDGNFIYAVNETNGANPGRVSAYSFNKNKGTLHFLNTVSSGGDDPCYLAINNGDKSLYKIYRQLQDWRH